MARHSSDPVKIESPEDRFQHDIERLEGGSGWKGIVRGLLIVVIAIGGVLAAYDSVGKKPPPPRLNAKGTMVIDTLEPATGKLDAAPTKFRWESVVGRGDYLFRVVEKGNPKPIVERPIRENMADLTTDELGRLVPGKSYIWQVEARAKDGKSIGSGRSYFDL